MDLSLWPLGDDQEVLSDLEASNPSKFDAVTKLLAGMKAVNPAVRYFVRNSKITLQFYYNRCFLSADLTRFLGEDVDLQLPGDPKRLKDVKGNDPVTFIRDARKEMMIISNGKTEIMYREWPDIKEEIAPPEFNGDQEVGVRIDLEDDFPDLHKHFNNMDSGDFILHNDQLDHIMSSDGRRYFFHRGSKDDREFSTSKTVLRSYFPLAVPGQTATLRVYRQNGHHWLETETTLGLDMNITLKEKLLRRL